VVRVAISTHFCTNWNAVLGAGKRRQDTGATELNRRGLRRCRELECESAPNTARTDVGGLVTDAARGNAEADGDEPGLTLRNDFDMIGVAGAAHVFAAEFEFVAEARDEFGAQAAVASSVALWRIRATSNLSTSSEQRYTDHPAERRLRGKGSPRLTT